MSDQDIEIADYRKGAGGWGALKAGMRMVTEEKDVAKAILALGEVNQPDGFDCPGCAWPEPNSPSKMEFCENGIKAVAAETTGKRVTSEFFAQNTVTSLLDKSDRWLEAQGRLTEPMRYDSDTDRYLPISWDAAFTEIGETLKSLDDPNEAIFYTSGRTSNEAAFLYQLFGRQFGTNNFPDCSNMCHESSGVALTEAIGIGKGTVQIHDFELADAIFVIGQNPGTNHPRMLSELQQASRRGAKIVSINPLLEPGLQSFTHPKEVTGMLATKATPISSHYLRPLVGGDLAVLNGLIKHLLEAEENDPGNILDHAFIAEHTAGFESMCDAVKNTAWEKIEEESGVSRDALKEIADVYREADSTIICWAMGITQHKHAVPTIQYLVNLLLLKGNLGRPGAGACPVRGHSNVQGDRTMGITEQPSKDFLESIGKVFDFEPPQHHGFDVVAAIKAMDEGRGKVFIGMGGNFAAATPDTSFTEHALRQCQLTAQVTTKLNRSHLVHGKAAYILPCLGRTEKDLQNNTAQQVTVEDSMGVVHASKGKRKPASPDLLSEPAIVAGLAKTTLEHSTTPWDSLIADYSRIRDHIEAVFPDLFFDFNERIISPGGFVLRNSASEREWKTAGEKAHFSTAPLPKLSLPEGCLRLTTLRSHDQYNTTVYSNRDRYRGISGTRKILFMNKADMAERDIAHKDPIHIESHFKDGASREIHDFIATEFDIPQGCAAAYFPEANVLISIDSVADRSKTPTSKFIPIRVKKMVD